jgi:hypothetical protein
MPITFRVFVLDESGHISGFPSTSWRRLWDGEAELPARAGQAVRFLEVPIETLNGLPVAMGEVDGVVLKLDRGGRLEPEQRERLLGSEGQRYAYLRTLAPSGRSKIRAHRTLARRQEESQEVHWAPSAAQINEVKARLTSRSRGE